MAETFSLSEDGPHLLYTYAKHNCGLRSAPRRTERTVEISVAEYWTRKVKNWEAQPEFVEVGAVTPYYPDYDWPFDIIIDPADTKATQKKSLFDADLRGKNVLCLSTIEHVGERSYGLRENKSPLQAYKWIYSQALNFLISFPWGWDNAKKLQDFVMQDSRVSVYTLTRQADETWKPSEIRLSYGSRQKPWANTVVFVEKGGLLRS